MNTMTRKNHGLTALALTATGLVGGASAPAAAPTIPTQCEQPGTEFYGVDARSNTTLTHNRGYQAPPGGSLRISKTSEVETTLSAGVNAVFEGGFSAGKILAKVEAKYNINLAASGSRTSRTSETVESTLAASNKNRFYAVYVARKAWSGTWELTRCNSQRQIFRVNRGELESYQVALEGVALCPSKNYKKGTAPNKACKATWE